MYSYCYICSVLYILFSSWQLAFSDYPDWGFSMLFPQLSGKCQGKTRKDGARTALILISELCCSVYCFVSIVFCVLFVCKCVLYYCHRASTQLQLTNISYHISHHIIYMIYDISYLIIPKYWGDRRPHVGQPWFTVTFCSPGQWGLFPGGKKMWSVGYQTFRTALWSLQPLVRFETCLLSRG